MATALIFILVVLSSSKSLESRHEASPYLSPRTFIPNYNKMLRSFKIYIYANRNKPKFTDSAESAFYSALVASQFLTSDPNQAQLFFIPFISSSLSTRSISRHIRDIRATEPYWNRTLGADHFYLHCAGLGYESDRNLVELKKNAVQISCFPSSNSRFIPHKDITLPPLLRSSSTSRVSKSKLVNDLVNDEEIQAGLPTGKRKYKYCLLNYDDGSAAMIGEALRVGCVPLVVAATAEGGVQDLPMMGVVRWAEMAVFVGGGVSGEEVRRVLKQVESGGGYERMRELGVASSRHFAWGDDEQQYDAFHSVMYQLWLRRHTIRYTRVFT